MNTLTKIGTSYKLEYSGIKLTFKDAHACVSYLNRNCVTVSSGLEFLLDFYRKMVMFHSVSQDHAVQIAVPLN